MNFKSRNMFRWLLSLCAISLLLTSILVVSNPVSADGGPWVGPDLWSYLTEGQQIAVIVSAGEGTADIDLFVSILDQTSESHEISFFLPLGTHASEFSVIEQEVNDFNADETRAFDNLLQDAATSRHTALASLFAGSVMANGYVLAPLWAPLLLSGCGAGVEPAAVYHTASSDISIYDVTEDTDINELSAVAGLPDGVRNTLAQLRGQQIAVVNLRTRPQSGTGSYSGYYGQSSEPGLHLSWRAEMVLQDNAETFDYSLGKGGAWSKPIELTRVYIFSPSGTDFSVEYPRLGSDQSGYSGLFGSPQIADYYQVPAYAVDEARGDFGRLWRITYTQSNPTEDIIIAFTPQSGWSRFQSGMAEHMNLYAFIFALVMGPMLWVLAWIIIMPRVTGGGKTETSRWYNGLFYPGINAIMFVFPGTILMLTLTLGLVLPSLAAIFIIFGGMSMLIFWLVQAGRMGVSKNRALLAFVLTGLASGAAYMALALAFASIAGII
jgi:hypothetical protein